MHKRKSFLNGKNKPTHVDVEHRIKVFFCYLTNRGRLPYACIRKNNVNPALFLGDTRIETVKVGKVSYIALHTSYIAADLCNGSVQFFLPPTSDIDVSAFGN